jgi:hypothetical protein
VIDPDEFRVCARKFIDEETRCGFAMDEHSRRHRDHEMPHAPVDGHERGTTFVVWIEIVRGPQNLAIVDFDDCQKDQKSREVARGQLQAAAMRVDK